MKFEVVRREGRGGQRLGKKDPSKMYKRLAQMYEENGESLNAEDVLAEAKHKSSPFHKWFEWDNGKAAHQHRLKQARDLIGSVDIVRQSDPRADKDGRIRAFVHLTRNVVDAKGNESVKRTYVPTVKAMGNPEQRQLLLKQAMADFENLERKYGALSELAAVFESISEVRDNVIVTVE
jgi:hypothetical protein